LEHHHGHPAVLDERDATYFVKLRNSALNMYLPELILHVEETYWMLCEARTNVLAEKGAETVKLKSRCKDFVDGFCDDFLFGGEAALVTSGERQNGEMREEIERSSWCKFCHS
jgi:hypothetical protein